VSSIASRGRLPLAYLEQLLNRLRRAGLVDSARGPKGGYFLARQPSAISLQEIVLALEGRRPRKATGPRPEAKDGELAAAVKQLWARVEAAASQVLEATSLQAICRDAQAFIRESKIEPPYTFDI
jgi:Rrf2 family iron-sulfur cluster assembly transcriptional regulator